MEDEKKGAEIVVRVDPKGCLGCLVLGGGLLAGLVFVAVKLLPEMLPRLIAWIMPQMMEMVDKAGVQMPCAKIILERMDADAAAECCDDVCSDEEKGSEA